MTLIFGFNGITRAFLISDSRVTLQGRTIQTQDRLIKIYPISPNPALAIGFSGNVAGAKKVLDFALGERVSELSRRAVIPEFAEKLSHWINYCATHRLSANESELSFLLAGVEGTRSVPLRRQDGSIGSSGLPEIYLYTYHLFHGRKLTPVRQGLEAIIGSGTELSGDVKKIAQELIGFGIGSGIKDDFRGPVISMSLASLFAQRGIGSVGGPFQSLELSRQGVRPGFHLAPEEMGEDFEVKAKDDIVSIRVPSKGIDYRLSSIKSYDSAKFPPEAKA